MWRYRGSIPMMLCSVLREQQKRMLSLIIVRLLVCNIHTAGTSRFCRHMQWYRLKEYATNINIKSSEGKITTAAHCSSVCNLRIGETRFYGKMQWHRLKYYKIWVMRVKYNHSSLLSFTYILGIEPDISSLFSKQWFLGDHILGYSRPLGKNSVTTSHSGCCRDLNGRTSEQPFTTCRLLFSDITGIIEHLLKWLIYLLQLKDFHSIQRGMSCLGVFIMVSP